MLELGKKSSEGEKRKKTINVRRGKGRRSKLIDSHRRKAKEKMVKMIIFERGKE